MPNHVHTEGGERLVLLNRELEGKRIRTAYEVRNRQFIMPKGFEVEVHSAKAGKVTFYGPECDCCGLRPRISEMNANICILTAASLESLLRERAADNIRKQQRAAERQARREAWKLRQKGQEG